MTTRSSARGGRRVVIVRQIGAGDEQRAAAAQRRGERVAERARRLRRSDSPSPAARSAAPARGAARNGSCISSECSRACAAGCSRTIGEAAAIARRAVVVDRRDAERRLEAAATDRSTTPSKPTKCDGPTSTATSNVRPREQPVGVRGDRPRVHQPGVRRDERDEVAGQRRGAVGGQMPSTAAASAAADPGYQRARRPAARLG